MREALEVSLIPLYHYKLVRNSVELVVPSLLMLSQEKFAFKNAKRRMRVVSERSGFHENESLI